MWDDFPLLRPRVNVFLGEGWFSTAFRFLTPPYNPRSNISQHTPTFYSMRTIHTLLAGFVEQAVIPIPERGEPPFKALAVLIPSDGC